MTGDILDINLGDPHADSTHIDTHTETCTHMHTHTPHEMEKKREGREGVEGKHRLQDSADQSRRSLHLKTCPVRSWKFPESHQAPLCCLLVVSVWTCGVGWGEVCSFLFPKPAVSYFLQPKSETFKPAEPGSSADYSWAEAPPTFTLDQKEQQFLSCLHGNPPEVLRQGGVSCPRVSKLAGSEKGALQTFHLKQASRRCRRCRSAGPGVTRFE